MKPLRLAILSTICVLLATSAQSADVPPASFDRIVFSLPDDYSGRQVSATLASDGSVAVTWRLAETRPRQLSYNPEQDRFEYVTDAGPRAVLASGERIPIDKVVSSANESSPPPNIRAEGNRVESNDVHNEWSFRLPEQKAVAAGTLHANVLGQLFFRDEDGGFYSLTRSGKLRFRLSLPQSPDVAECAAGANGDAVCASASFGVIGIQGRGQAPRLRIDGTERFFPQPPEIRSGTAYVPFRSLFEAMGATVSWNQKNRTASASKGKRTVRLTIGASTAYVNGKQVKLDHPPVERSGTTLVPLRFVSEALGYYVVWEDATKTIQIATP